MPDDEQLGVVLVHGLWHGPWVWDEVRRELTAGGLASAVVDLPMTDLAADVAATTRALDDVDRPAILVGHSYGGAVITEAGAHRQVRQLLYLAAFQLTDGESVGRTLPELDVPATRLGDALRFSENGDEVSLDATLAGELMYADVPSPTRAAAVARLRPVHRAVFAGVPATIAWRHLPSTYVVCSDDRAVHPDLQRAMALRSTRRHVWPGGHSIAATRPREVAELIISIASGR